MVRAGAVGTREGEGMEQSPLIEVGLPISLFIIMVGIGLTLTLGDFRREARQPRGTVVGSLLQLLLMPAVGFVLVWALGLSGAIAVGLIIIAACPGGTTSNLITYLARGNVALSIVMTVVASLATILTLPIFVNLALGMMQDGSETVSLPVLQTVATLVVIVLLPVAIGMVVRSLAPEFARRAERAVSLFGALVLLLLIVGIAASVWEDLGTLLLQAGPACVALNLAGIGFGLLSAKLAGLPQSDRLAIAVELGIKNSTIGLLVAISLLESPEMAVPPAVYGLLMYAFGFAMIAYGRRTGDSAASPAKG